MVAHLACCLALAPALPPVSYSRDIAPILAFHCHYCHGNRRQVPAGDLDTRTFASLMRGGGLGDVIRPGNPDRSVIVQFLEGKRGADKRMPEKAEPLGAAEIATIRRWIAEGARPDQDTTPRYVYAARSVLLDKAQPLDIACLTPVKSYISVRIRDESGKLLLMEEGPVKAPKGPHDVATPGQWIRWRLWPETYWPRRVNVEMEIVYPDRNPAGAQLRVKAGAREHSGALVR